MPIVNSPHTPAASSRPCQPWLSLSGRWHATALLFTFLCLASMAADDSATNSVSKFPCNDSEIARYTAYHINQPIHIDGQLDEPCWRAAPRSPRFTDILTGNPTLYETRAAVLWDNDNLYIGFWVEEPRVKATLTEYGSYIYKNNDVEVFIAG